MCSLVVPKAGSVVVWVPHPSQPGRSGYKALLKKESPLTPQTDLAPLGNRLGLLVTLRAVLHCDQLTLKRVMQAKSDNRLLESAAVGRIGYPFPCQFRSRQFAK